MLSKFSRDAALAVVIFVLVVGSVILAVIDPLTRPAFVDLTKVVVSFYAGLYIPSPGQR